MLIPLFSNIFGPHPPRNAVLMLFKIDNRHQLSKYACLKGATRAKKNPAYNTRFYS